jgi:C1A family cysteine protease
MTCLPMRVRFLGLLLPVIVVTSAAVRPAAGQTFGCDPSPTIAFETHPHVRIAAKRGLDRPKHFDIAADLPPIGNQGGTNACVGWSTAYYCFTTSVARQRQLTPEQRKDPRFVFSPAFIWHQYNEGKNQGMCIYQAFDILEKQGCASMAEMPWVETDILTQPDERAKTRALRYKARRTVCLFKGQRNNDPADPEKLKNWLWETKQPFVTSITVFKDFVQMSHDPNYVYKPSEPRGEMLGRHAVCIVGYDEDKHAFLMVNSWTDSWANKGLIWLHEDYMKEANEGWGQRPGGPVSRGLKGPQPSMPSISYDPAKKAE